MTTSVQQFPAILKTKNSVVSNFTEVRGEERRGEERDRIGMWRAGGVVFVIVVRIHTKTGQNYINCRLENRTLLFE